MATGDIVANLTINPKGAITGAETGKRAINSVSAEAKKADADQRRMEREAATAKRKAEREAEEAGRRRAAAVAAATRQQVSAERAELQKLEAELNKLDREFQSMETRRTVAAGKSGTRTAMGALELGRGLEDASVGFALNGIQGAIRGSMNNITTMLTSMGGPWIGAIAGIFAAGITLGFSFFDPESKRAQKFAKDMEALAERLNRMQEDSKRGGEFALELRDAKGLDSIDEAIRKRRDELSVIDAQNKALEEQHRLEFKRRLETGNATWFLPIPFVDERDDKRQDETLKRVNAVGERQLKLLHERMQLEEEITRLQEKADNDRSAREFSLWDLRQQEASRGIKTEYGDSDADMKRREDEIRRHDERKAREEEQRQKQKQAEDKRTAEGLGQAIEQRIGQLSPEAGRQMQRDKMGEQLDQLDVGVELRERMLSLMQETEGGVKPVGFASAVTAGTAEAERAIITAREVQKQTNEAQKQVEELKKVNDALSRIAESLEPSGDSVPEVL